MSILNIATTLFIIANPIGNSPAIIALIKNFSFKKQKSIMLRETVLSFIIALFFQYLGKVFLNSLNIENYAVSITGGVLLMLVAFGMIFSPSAHRDNIHLKQEPIIVPIATPLISGPCLLTVIMLFSHQEENFLTISAAIALAWIGITTVLLGAPYINKILHKKGLEALEQLMGLVLAMLAIEMFTQGITNFVEVL